MLLLDGLTPRGGALSQGLGTGTVILLASSGKHSRILVFSEDLFFIYLLPPIIFNAGYVLVLMRISKYIVSMVLFLYMID